uniref:Myb_CC_LHEQLE domain-containing protein n=1 Tax=Globodera pallida TaxID=36090 RepID=A0A183BRF1_GLOPA
MKVCSKGCASECRRLGGGTSKQLTELEALRAEIAVVKQREAQMLLRMDKLGAAFNSMFLGEVDTLAAEQGKAHNIGEEKGVDGGEEAQTKSDKLEQRPRQTTLDSICSGISSDCATNVQPAQRPFL